MRSFGLAHVSADSLLHGFPDLVEGTLDCPPNCEHTAAEEDCALDAWVAAGTIEPSCASAVREVAAHPDWLDLAEMIGEAAQLLERELARHAVILRQDPGR